MSSGLAKTVLMVHMNVNMAALRRNSSTYNYNIIRKSSFDLFLYYIVLFVTTLVNNRLQTSFIRLPFQS